MKFEQEINLLRVDVIVRRSVFVKTNRRTASFTLSLRGEESSRVE